MIDLLLVDDDFISAKMIHSFFEVNENFNLSVATSCCQAREYFGQNQPHIVIQDIHLPDGDGFDLAEYYRAQADVGIIMISASDTVDDKVKAVEMGADIYLNKPIDLRYLDACVRSLCRRIHQEKTIKKLVAEIEPIWKLDPKNWLLIAPNGEKVELTATEYELVKLLVNNDHKPVKRQEVAKYLNRENSEGYDLAINTMISRLRKKVLKSTGHALSVRAYRGEGYVMVSDFDLQS